jgi:hypothetical protein
VGWFRTNRGIAIWAAFFALACQLVLLFGHVHVGKFGGGSPAWAAAEPGEAPSPEGDPAGAAGDFCAICANINLAGAVVLPILAILLPPGPFIGILHWLLAAAKPASFDRRPFNARGPPHA